MSIEEPSSTPATPQPSPTATRASAASPQTASPQTASPQTASSPVMVRSPRLVPMTGPQRDQTVRVLARLLAEMAATEARDTEARDTEARDTEARDTDTAAETVVSGEIKNPIPGSVAPLTTPADHDEDVAA